MSFCTVTVTLHFMRISLTIGLPPPIVYLLVPAALTRRLEAAQTTTPRPLRLACRNLPSRCLLQVTGPSARWRRQPSSCRARCCGRSSASRRSMRTSTPTESCGGSMLSRRVFSSHDLKPRARRTDRTFTLHSSSPRACSARLHAPDWPRRSRSFPRALVRAHLRAHTK